MSNAHPFLEAHPFWIRAEEMPNAAGKTKPSGRSLFRDSCPSKYDGRNTGLYNVSYAASMPG